MPPFDPIANAMQSAVAHGVFPGAVLFVRERGQVRCHQAFGFLSVGPERQPASIDTIYDLASLTKPLATATAVLCLVQDGLVRLDDAIEAFLPELKGYGAGGATVLHLLNHSSGLPAWRAFYERVAERDREQPGFLGSEAARRMVLDEIRREVFAYPVGTQSLYSDVGFILLGMMVERVTGHSLDAFCQERIYIPCRVQTLFFPAAVAVNSRHSSDSLKFIEQVAPTEHDPWRDRVLRAEVHDENAYALGGVAGHAGLFGTAAGVATMTGLWLESYVGRSSFLSTDLVHHFTSRQTNPSETSWGLGWDTPSAPSSSGVHFSSLAFGHLGFTGTSIWIDPACELEVVLLSNRVHPTRRNAAIQKFRPAIHDVIYEEVIGGSSRSNRRN